VQNRDQNAYTLVELLVVIAVIAVLMALLFPTFHKAQGKSRESNCTSNLHQIASALECIWADNDEMRPPRIQPVADQYIKSAAVLVCPNDPTGNWGGIYAEGFRDPSRPPETTRYSYLFPTESMEWSERAWNQLTSADSNAGIVTDELHAEKRTPKVRLIPDYEGLFLMARLDGSVHSRQVHWKHGPNGNVDAESWYLFTDVPHNPGAP